MGDSPGPRQPGTERIRRCFDRLTILSFVAMLVIPLIALAARWDLRGGEEDEKRAPAPFPAWTWAPAGLAAFPKQFDAWFQDHFGFRRLLIRGHSMLSYYVLRTAPSPKVVIGKEGWLYYDGVHARDGDPIAEYRGTRAETAYQLERWRWAFQDVSDWLQQRHTRFLVVLVPAKESIYPEYLPDHLAPVGPSARTQVVAHLERHGRFELLDLTPIVREARGGEPLYAKSDTHWTAYGAHVGYRAIIERLRVWYPGLQPWSPSDFTVRRGRDLGGDLAQMMDLRRVMTEETVVMEPLRRRRARVTTSGDRDVPSVVSEVDDPRLPRAVIFRDSFGNALVPYLSEHFRRALYAWSRQGLYLSPIVTERPDVVLHIVADRALGHGFRYPTVMQVEANARRFDESRDVLATIDGAVDFRGVRPLSGCTIERRGDDLLVTVTAATAVHLEIPAVARGDVVLPIVRVDVTAPERTDLDIRWDSPHRRRPSARVRYEVSGPLARGRTQLSLPLVDPDLTGPLRLGFAHRGRYLLHRIEVRGVPRYGHPRRSAATPALRQGVGMMTAPAGEQSSTASAR